MDCGLRIKDDYEIVITQGDTLSYKFEISNYDDDYIYGLHNLKFLCEGLNLKLDVDKWGISLDTFQLYASSKVTSAWDAGVYKYNLVCNYNSSWTEVYTLINDGVFVVLPQVKIGG